jgi:hypothetical protein
MKPLAIDLYCGLGGWTEGLLAEGYDPVGFDIEQHQYGDHRYPGQLVVQDVLTLHGSQFKDAALIVASPPCQEYSYMAMPWKLAKAKAAAIRADTTGESLERLNRLFNACFRIQAEASLAAGHHIPMIVENVRGAIPWVGRARWNFGSFYLWGDVPALMPHTIKAQKFNPDGTAHPPGSWFAVADSKNRGSKVPGFRFDGSGRSFQTASVNAHKVPSQSGGRTDVGKGARFTSRDCVVEAAEGRKGAGAGAEWFDQNLCRHGSKSLSRKQASAMIAKIPLPLSRHIARVYHPGEMFQQQATR